MINSTNTINIDGTVIDHDEIRNSFDFNNSDKFTRWVVRPLALLTAIGMGVAMFFASAFLSMLSLAMLPLLAVSMWAVKTKLERDINKQEINDNGTPVTTQE